MLSDIKIAQDTGIQNIDDIAKQTGIDRIENYAKCKVKLPFVIPVSGMLRMPEFARRTHCQTHRY
ncbi:MAG: hypothetical protein LBE04_01360 [Prevotellaceae bacterium]|jgi:formyltetrahydrofolate synthetase|nr:hypothetical protein [Prevotellaceae bacterium]